MNQEDYVNDDVGYVEGEWTEINVTLRGTHEFYVYLNNSFNLAVLKEDINRYIGKAYLLIELYDLNGNLKYMNVIEDDGYNGYPLQKKTLQSKTFEIKIEEGVYILKLNAKSDHIYIQNIKINTNKIMTTGTIHPLEQVNLYMNEYGNISFYYWHSNKDQRINITGDYPKIIDITKEDRYKVIDTVVDGENRINIPKGDIRLISNINFAFHKENMFHPFILKTDNEWPNYFVYDDKYRSWIYKEDRIRILGDNLKIKNIRLVFEHDSI